MKLARITRLEYKHLCLKQQTDEVVQLVHAGMYKKMRACMHPHSVTFVLLSGSHSPLETL